MKKKILTLCIVSAMCLSLTTGCGNKTATTDTTVTSNQTEATQTEEKTTEETKDTKTSKRKYDEITADSVPVGVDELKIKSDEDGYTIISGRIYKNSSEIEEGIIGVTFELYDENDEYICKKSFETVNSLTEGEDSRFEGHLLWEADDEYNKNVPAEKLEKYTLKIVDIKEVDAAEVAEAAELATTIQNINRCIMSQEYNTAQVLLEAALQKYPDNVDLKLLQANLDDALSKGAEE